MAGFIDVLLRGIALCGQSVAIGGVLFALLVLRPAAAERPALRPLLRRSRLLIALGAAAAAIAQALSLATQVHQLADHRGWPVRDILATSYFDASLVRIGACAGLIIACWVLSRGGERRGGWTALTGLIAVLSVGSAMTSHAASRIEHRELLLALDGLHQVAVAAWVGGLIHLTALALPSRAAGWPAFALRRFSALALASVATLVAAGVGLTVYYVDGVSAMIGTAYGMMILTKVAILAILVGLGALNFFAVRRLDDRVDVVPARLRRFVEVELGLGVTVLFAAASLTSLPPAVDVVRDRATLAEVATRFTPRMPALASRASPRCRSTIATRPAPTPIARGPSTTTTSRGSSSSPWGSSPSCRRGARGGRGTGR